MVRDEEIERLVNYSKGLGFKVTFSSRKGDCSAFWYTDGSGIVVYKNKNKAKIDIILTLIHELGHAVHSIHERDRQVDEKVDKALNDVDEAEELGVDPKKRARKIILEDERNGAKWWHSIYKETNMKFPIWRLEAAMEHDLWHYEYCYEYGKEPSYEEKREHLKKVNAKHRRKKNV